MTSTPFPQGRTRAPGLMLLLLQVVAVLGLGLAAGYFHHRVDLLLEPVTAACGGPDPAARLRMAEVLMARAGALDDWQPLRWLPVAGMVLALLGAMAICVHWWHRVRRPLRTTALGLMALHASAMALAAWTLHLYEDAWNSVVRLSPTACLVDLTQQGRMPLEQAQEVVFHIFTRAHAPLQRNPDDLALVLVALLTAAMVGGVALWRAAAAEEGR
ncbi:hypothetical protein JAK58_08125 [Stenotrophomonas maltophilia]|jgi:hypothetical protein|uniref:Transmembrane protein n=2 Tax=Lysobacteraceae TaxID=32033 RepID=A0AAP7GQH2_STEMA|nr:MULTISPECIES: hypothetical protein [Stenotrophomonas]MBE5271455.1 hypothetical protein [Stenotrophomonas sp. B2]MDI9249913.1 hypothetical protein [Stenotrophomonas sp. RS-48]RXK68815.1 hypothetical protein ERT44_04735 [Stenotrophomonas sp. MA5]KOQ68821.1 membrane protein [Stenotrophomonas maltophilia]MBH1591279.1 hypothetical protein [Stenotrophomonas maltophilia]